MATQSLKIALIVDHFLPRIGGIELQVRDLALHLAEAGHRPEILTTTPGSKDLAEFSQTKLSQNVPIHRLDVPLMPGFKIPYRPKSLKILQKHLSSGDFDIIHSHISVVSPLAYGALKIAHELGIPSVMSAHSLLENSIAPLKLLWRCCNGPQWRWVPTGVSTALATGLKKIVDAQEVGVLPNGIHLKDWYIDKQTHQGLNVISVSRLNKKKRVQALLKQIPKILSQLKDPHEVKFHFVGKGPYEKTLKNLTQRLGLKDNVVFHGYKNREQIKELLAQSDVFVLPSKKESFGIALLEARAAGVPVVALSYGGPRDLIKSGQNGILADNDQEMAKAVVTLLTDTKKREAMAAQTQLGLAQYDWQEIIKRCEGLYQRLLKVN